MRRLAMVVMLVGCGEPPESDLDGDGLADDVDDCVAGFPDEDVDADLDGKPAREDLCPHELNAPAGDLDFDGIPDACDPFPAVAAAKDTRRCVTSFQVPWMNAAYLTNRAGEAPWDVRPRLVTGKTHRLMAKLDENVSVLSTFTLDYPSATLEVLGSATFATADATSSFKIWLRANPDQPSSQDLGCGVDGTQHLFVWADNRRQEIRPLPAALRGPFRLRATIQDDATHTVLCRVTAGGTSITTRFGGVAPLADGRWGFAAATTDVTLDSLVIDVNETPQVF